MLRQWWPEKLGPCWDVGPCNFLVLCHDSSCTLFSDRPCCRLGSADIALFHIKALTGVNGMDSRRELVRWVHLWSAQTRPGAGNFMQFRHHSCNSGNSGSLWDQIVAEESEVLGPDVLRGRSAWAPRRTETHRDADRFWLCCKICKALSFSFEEHQVLEGEGSGLPPEGHWNFQECSWFMGSSLVIRKLNHRYHRHFMAFLTIKSITGTRHSISVETCAVVVVIVPLAAHRLASGTYRAPLRRNPDMAETQRLGEIRMDPMNIHCWSRGFRFSWW